MNFEIEFRPVGCKILAKLNTKLEKKIREKIFSTRNFKKKIIFADRSGDCLTGLRKFFVFEFSWRKKIFFQFSFEVLY